jgi:hypothetical protein
MISNSMLNSTGGGHPPATRSGTLQQALCHRNTLNISYTYENARRPSRYGYAGRRAKIAGMPNRSCLVRDAAARAAPCGEKFAVFNLAPNPID